MAYSRRQFILRTGALTAATALIPSISHSFSANDKVVVALIGCRNMGWHNLMNMLKVPGVECAALCDVDENILKEKGEALRKATDKSPALYKDYRKIIEDKSIDAVIIGTPDHWHCLPFVHACEAGKDIYVEKPVANSIGEAEIMWKAARKYGTVVQVGQQQRSGQHWQDAISLVKSGKMGKIRKIKTWANFPYGKTSARQPDSEVPQGFDYDFWLGPAPKRPFNENRSHGNWRFIWDYGGGLMTDWGVHLLDIPLWILDGAMPNSVVSVGGIYAYPENALETADTQTVLYEYPDMILEWEHLGGLNTRLFGRNYGVAFAGENGILVIDRQGWELIPESENNQEKMEAIPLQEGDKTDHQKHTANFIECIKSRKRTICDIEDGRNAAVLAHMGNIAYRLGEKLQWDPVHHNFKNSNAANEMINPVYRAPWELPRI